MITEPSEFMQQLQAIQDSTSVTYSTLPSDEPRFIIDANTRSITIPPEFQFLGVKNDHKAETVYFEIDRYFDAVDLSTHTCVVQFSNSSNSGLYPVTVMDTETVDGKIIFGWEIMNDVTAIVGNINFSVRFYSVDENSQFIYNFNTLTANSVILDTLDVDNPGVVENYPSELEAWLDRMNDLSQNVVKPEDVQALDTKMNTLETSFGELETNVNSSVDGLKSDLDDKKNGQYLCYDKTPLNLGYKGRLEIGELKREYEITSDGTEAYKWYDVVTKDALYLEEQGYLIIPSNIGVKVARYDENKNFQGLTNWHTNEVYTLPNADVSKYYRFIFTSASNGEITYTILDNDIILNGIKIYYGVNPIDIRLNNLDRGLSNLDSKVNTDYEKLIAYKGFDSLHSPLSNGFTNIINCDIELGSLDTSDGAEISSNDRLRTKMITSDTNIYVYKPVHIYHKLFTYSKSGAFISATQWDNRQFYNILSSEFSYRFIFATEEFGLPNKDELTNVFDVFTNPLKKSEKISSVFVTEADDCITKLKNECNEDSFVFAIITDTHYTENSNFEDLDTIKYIHDRYPLDSVYHLGDIINGTESQGRAEKVIDKVRSKIININENNYMLVGNHDGNDWYDKTNHTNRISKGRRFSLAERYNCKNYNMQGNNAYGYRDYDTFGIRVIVLDSFVDDSEYGYNSSSWGYSDEEVTWFDSVALNTNNKVIILSHMSFTEGFNAYGSKPVNSDGMINAVNKYINNGGTVIGLFHGHTHWDFIGDNGKFKEISTGCALCSTTSAEEYSYIPSGASVPTREKGNVSEFLYDIVIVKPNSNSVKMIRYGAGSDRDFTY